jgi:hypothetical protein
MTTPRTWRTIALTTVVMMMARRPHVVVRARARAQWLLVDAVPAAPRRMTITLAMTRIRIKMMTANRMIDFVVLCDTTLQVNLSIFFSQLIR